MGFHLTKTTVIGQGGPFIISLESPFEIAIGRLCLY
jgi:hypothetical protein